MWKTRVLATLSVGALAVTLAAAPAAAVSPGWTQPGYGAGHNFYNPAESAINAASINKVKKRWSAKLPDIELSCTKPAEPLAYGGRVFVTDDKGIGAYQAGTGKRSWHWDWAYPDNEYTPHLAVAGGLLIAGNTECQSQSDPNGGIVALSLTTGKVKWQVAAGGPVETVVVDKGMVVVAGSSESSDPSVRAYRLSDGKARWSLAEHWSPGVSANGKLLVTRTDAAGVAAVDITTGKRAWSKPIEWQPIAAAGDMYFATDKAGRLIGAKLANGAATWTNTMDTGAPALLAADGKRVYRTVVNGIEALDVKKGKRLWLRQFEGDTSQPVRAGGLLYTNVDAGQPVGVLNAATGRVVSSGKQFGNDDGGNVVVADGWLFRVFDHSLEGYRP
ncbi:PQQ-binding-like beta-propeller repeat protein [Actinoplanes sp. NPDC051859]|uniref:outer membrane protein assembly factor BamB family protein n=1 Tax=Actinoplanes sp. NPDC051859 TaxID=3363909 RepID=UPI0037979740